MEETENFAPLYGRETDQDPNGLSKSERDMDFVRRMMLSALVQDVVARAELVGQNLLLATNGDDSQRLRRHALAYRAE